MTGPICISPQGGTLSAKIGFINPLNDLINGPNVILTPINAVISPSYLVKRPTFYVSNISSLHPKNRVFCFAGKLRATGRCVLFDGATCSLSCSVAIGGG